MSESVYLLTICLPLATVLIVFGMRYRALVLQARARAAPAIENAGTLKTIADALTDLQVRLSGIEKILKAVE